MYVIFKILSYNYEEAIHAQISYSGRDNVLIILFQLYGSKTGLFQANLFWVGRYGHHPPPSPTAFIGRRTNPTLKY